MKFKRTVLAVFLVSVVISVGLGVAQKAYSAHQDQDDTPYPPNTDTYPSPAGLTFYQQVGGMSGIILGGIAIILIIIAGVGFNYRTQTQ